jgi:hypothetical protein
MTHGQLGKEVELLVHHQVYPVALILAVRIETPAIGSSHVQTSNLQETNQITDRIYPATQLLFLLRCILFSV